MSIKFEKVIKKVEKLENKAIADTNKIYSRTLKEMRNLVREKFDKYGVDGKLTYEEMAKYSRRKKLNKEISQNMKDLWVETGGVTRQTIRNIYKESYIVSKSIMEEAANTTIRGKYTREAAQRALQNPISGLTLNERLSKRRRDIITQIQETIGQGLMNNESYTSMSGRLKKELEQDVSKAHRIIRTESHRVSEQGKFDSIERAASQGVKVKKYWIDSGDDRVRDSHSDMGDKYNEDNPIDIDSNFFNDDTGGVGLTPGQLGTAEDDIHCRCNTGYVIVQEEG